MARLEITDLFRWYSPDAPGVLAGVDLTVDDDLVVILGASGSGKTTLLRCIAGLERPDGGEIRIAGEDVASVPPPERGLAYVTQESTLLPHLTVEANMRFPLEVRGISADEQERRVLATARVLGLEGLFERRPRELGAGQARAVSTARQLTRAPQVFLFDEPLGNVDPQERRTLRREIRLLQRGFDVSMLYATNDPDDAYALADRLAVLDAGRIVQIAAPMDVYARPATLATAHLSSRGPVNVICARATAGGLDVSGYGRLRIPDLGHRGPVQLAVRAEDVSLEPSDGTLALAVDVDHVTYLGAHTVIHARGHDGAPVVAHVHRSPGVPSPEPDEPCVLHAPLDRVHVFDATDGRAVRHRLR